MNRTKIVREFREVINKNNLENESDTPDFILAEHLVDCLAAFNNTANARRSWYGETVPASSNGRKVDPESMN